MTQSTGIQLPQLSAYQNYLTDPDGNVVILRGYNLCSKTAQTPEQVGFGIRNASFLRECGVSVVRLGVPWANVQPYLLFNTDGSLQYDMQFLASIKRTIQLLSEFGIYTLVDFHQDAYAVPWGFGAPSWAVVAGGTNTPNFPWPFNTFGGDTYQIEGNLTPIETDLNVAFDAFWQNQTVTSDPSLKTSQGITQLGIPLLEAFGAMLRFVSSYLSDQQGNILGYDPINEPEPGSQWTEAYSSSDPKNLFNFPNGCQQFDQNDLAVFYQQYAIPNLQAGHPGAMIWYEPNIYFDYNAPTFLPPMGVGNVGFNFHNYDAYHAFANPMANALAYQSTANVPLLCSEFGGTTLVEDIQAVVTINDQNMLSAIFWAWFNNARFNFAPNVGGPTDPRAMGVVQVLSEDLVPPNVNQQFLNVLTSVYPRVTAGTPNSFSTTQSTPLSNVNGTFSFEYSTQLPNKQVATGTTVIVVPSALYPNGFNVTAPGANVTQLDGIVELVVDSPTPTTISVQIQPK